jgi:hypothetical protein
MMLHDAKFFCEESIKRNAEKYGFSSNLPIELFLWDCEIAAQIQSHSQDLVLKGGAAVQLHLPVKMQRGSIDIDLVGNLSETEVDDILKQIPRTLPDISFKIHKPQSPIPKIPMITYYANLPSLVSERRERGIQLKTEFLLEDLELPNEIITKAPTFALDAKNIKCYSVSSLIGDKLLTLAGTTIGVLRGEDVPKQLYDVASLSRLHALSDIEFSQIGDTIEKLVPIEAGYRGKQLEIDEVIRDIQNSLEKYRLLGTSRADPSVWDEINSFQQFYVNSSQKINRDEWSQRAWQLTFLNDLVNDVINNQSAGECAAIYSSSLAILDGLEKVSKDKIVDLKKDLLKFVPAHTPNFKELKVKSPQRIFYQIVTKENIDDIQSLLE